MYKRLIRRGLAELITCPHCDQELTMMLGEDDQPVFKCFFCNTLTIPGTDMYDRVKAVVKEHFA